MYTNIYTKNPETCREIGIKSKKYLKYINNGTLNENEQRYYIKIKERTNIKIYSFVGFDNLNSTLIKNNLIIQDKTIVRNSSILNSTNENVIKYIPIFENRDVLSHVIENCDIHTLICLELVNKTINSFIKYLVPLKDKIALWYIFYLNQTDDKQSYLRKKLVPKITLLTSVIDINFYSELLPNLGLYIPCIWSVFVKKTGSLVESSKICDKIRTIILSPNMDDINFIELAISLLKTERYHVFNNIFYPILNNKKDLLIKVMKKVENIEFGSSRVFRGKQILNELGYKYIQNPDNSIYFVPR